MISLRTTLATVDTTRRRAIGQILLLAAGFLVLVAISASSVILVNQSRKDNGWVVHTVEVENQMDTLLLQVRRAESATRGFLLTSEPRFRTEYEMASAAAIADADKLRTLSHDNPAQVENIKRLQQPLDARLEEFAKIIDFVNRHDAAGGVAVMREVTAGDAAQRMNDIVEDMRAEENKLFAQRTQTADRTQQLASIVTVVGSGLVIALAGISIFLVRRSSRARDHAEARLRDSNLNLEATVDERTADLREANDEIQRFAYIISHDLRSPLVNIMGFTSELEQLRGDIFRRIATLDRAGTQAPLVPADAGDIEPVLEGEDQQLSQGFAEALGFIKSSIGKMDRLISAILNLTREGRREFQPVKIDTRELIEGIVATVAHQAA
ncbi:MAG TPA: CHASE3 domain-containing protein, partial [Bradyrhizobium sp.]